MSYPDLNEKRERQREEQRRQEEERQRRERRKRDEQYDYNNDRGYQPTTGGLDDGNPPDDD